MRCHKLSLEKRATMFAAVFLTATLAAAQQEIILHSFGNATDGTSPNGSLISDAAGNLYGTTLNGGAYEGHAVYTGTAFKLAPVKGGGWTETILHSFANGSDGFAPATGLISDAAGNLYGTTTEGGGSVGCVGSTPGCGIVFQLRPPATKNGPWTEVVLYRFNNGNDGANPQGVLTLDSSGNLYGTTNTLGGSFYSGSVFELSPRAAGNWRISVLHVFNGNGGDGAHPLAGLTFDSSGNLYGTTCQGGTYGGGTVFELSPKTGGGWSEKILHDFNSTGNGGSCPNGVLIFDSSGNLYGTTGGTVFQLSPSGAAWTENVIYRFNGGSTDGSDPCGGVIFDAVGNLYGATFYGGTYNRGTIFELTPNGGGWSENIVHNFGSGADGTYPSAGNLLIDSAGNLYGATGQGGAYDGLFGSGTVFELTP